MIVKIYSLLKFKNNGYQNVEFAFDELKKNINKKKRFSLELKMKIRKFRLSKYFVF